VRDFERALDAGGPLDVTRLQSQLLSPVPTPQTAVGRAGVVRSLVPIALGIAAVSLAFGVLGYGVHHWGVPRLFDLDGERTAPAAWSGGLLAIAAFLALRVDAEVPARPRWALGLAVFFAFMALDEVVEIHERLEYWTGVDWEILYVPIALAGGIGWLLGVRACLRALPASALLLGAGAAWWLFSQTLEALQWDGGVKTADYMPMMYAEEVGEMLGSGCFLLAMLALLRAVCRAPRVPVLSGSAGRSRAGFPRCP
jgi:hypothetical protein